MGSCLPFQATTLYLYRSTLRRSDREKKQRISFWKFVTFCLVVQEVSQIAMPPTKPLEVEILRRDPDSLTAEDDWVPYQEYGAKMKTSTNNWSCYILAKEGEVSAISALLRLHPHTRSKHRCLPFDARTRQRTFSQFGFRPMLATFSSTSSGPLVWMRIH